MFDLQSDIWSAPRDDVYLRGNLSNQDVARTATDMTICLRVYHTQLTALQTLVSYASSDDNNDAILFSK